MSQVQHHLKETTQTHDASISQVKAAFSSALLGDTTIFLLSNLLGLPGRAVSDASKHSSKPITTTTISSRRSKAKSSDKRPPDRNEVKPLTATAKRRLATEVATLGSQLLARTRPTSRTLQTGSPSSERALQPRSGNTTLKTQTQDASKKCEPRARVTVVAEGQALLAAQCTHLALTHLRFSGTAETRCRLLEASLAFCRHLLAHRLGQVLILELEACSVLLQPLEARTSDEISKLKTVQRMMEVGGKTDSNVEMLRLTVVHQTLVIKAVALLHDSSMIEQLAEYLTTSTLGPHRTIKDYMQATKHNDKAAMHMEAIASDLSSIRSTATSTDGTLATSPGAGALAIFRIQVYALHLRRIWWMLTKHNINVEQTVCEQYMKHLRVFVRKATSQLDSTSVWQAAESGYKLVFEDPRTILPASFEVLTSMCSLAVAGGSDTARHDWRLRLDECCGQFGDSDCRKLAVLARELSRKEQRLDEVALDDFATTLGNELHGEPEHYEVLLAEVSKLIRTQRTTCQATASSPCSRLIHNALKLSRRIAGAYPTIDSSSSRSIICSALRICSRTQLASWIDQQAIRICTGGGVLRALSRTAETASLKCAFMSSPEAIALGEVIDILVLKQLTSNIDEFDKFLQPVANDSLALEQGMLLDWRLRACLKHTASPSNRTVLQDMCKTTLCRLEKLYDAARHPVRRALLGVQATLAFGKALIADKAFEPWKDCSLKDHDLQEDVGLARFSPDIRASLLAVSVLQQATRSPSKVRAAMNIWQKILHSTDDLDNVVYDKTMLAGLLETVASLCKALGWNEECTMAYQLLNTLHKLAGSSPSRRLQAMAAACESSTIGGYPLEMTQEVLGALNDATLQPIDRLRGLLAVAQYHLVHLSTKDCRSSLNEVYIVQATITCQPSVDKRELAIMCAKAWWLQSRLCSLEADLVQAMRAAKTAVSLVNSLWRRLEQRQVNDSAIMTDDDGETTVKTGLIDKISKLQLRPASDETKQGPAYWSLVPLACDVLMQAADVHVHAGLFREAHAHAVRAVAIADAMPDSLHIISARAKLATILTLAGRADDAELCLAKLHIPDNIESCFALVDLYRARARISANANDLHEALKYIGKAAKTINEINTRHVPHSLPQQLDAPRMQRALTVPSVPKSRSAAATRTKKPGPIPVKAEPVFTTDLEGHSMHMMEDIKVERARIEQKLRSRCSVDVVSTLTAKSSSVRQLKYLKVMSTFEKKAQTDVVFNSLAESSLVCPGLQRSSYDDQPKNERPQKSSSIGRKKPLGAQVKHPASQHTLSDLLVEAGECLEKPTMSSRCAGAMADVHKEGKMLVTSSIFSSTTHTAAASHDFSSMDICSMMSIPASIAKMREIDALHSDSLQKSAQLCWPALDDNQQDGPLERIAPSCEISSILPEDWTVVSLSLSPDATELVVARQRKNETALIVRLPFAREEMDVEVPTSFDFAAGKAELQDIIEQSNRICHAGNDTSKKTASATWWREREHLDKRLHELLVNIEEIWFGGFKGILCPVRTSQLEMAQFRNDFETILGRHLPVAKGNRVQQDWSVPDTTLHLFLNLLRGRNDAPDIDTPVLDLLYSVVDTQRFHGRELAYDEIDFDGLTVEMVDAIQAHHESITAQDADAHLILVLDKSLQNFPWESLPCLENTSVSRMGDMLLLRERIISMSAKSTKGRHYIKHDFGTIILDPAADMKRTQETMKPAIQYLLAQQPSWRTITGRAPSEDEFQAAVTSSSITMYFGHGAGSQYIRPRTVKKLDRCSEVVWLMGCSSGAVTEHGELEPTSVPASYLLAGSTSSTDGAKNCLAVVANLWDVTDKDIDRFSIAVGEDWGLWSIPDVEKTKTKGKRAHPSSLTTPPMSPKTPKAPKTLRTTTASKTPQRRQSKKGRSGSMSLCEAVTRSRDACYLRYLNGAAPVVYGVPVYLGQ